MFVSLKTLWRAPAHHNAVCTPASDSRPVPGVPALAVASCERTARFSASLSHPTRATDFRRQTSGSTRLFFGLLLIVTAAHAQAAERKPFFNAREQQTEYAGPGREDATSDDVSEIRIGYFGPADGEHPDGGDMWRAATLAIEEANACHGVDGKPVRLLSAWSEDPWGTGIKQLTELVYEQRVWAIIGGIDGPTTHLAEQVVAKARLPLVSPISTDKTVNLANVPWMFSLAPGDHLQTPVLADAIAARAGNGTLVSISSNDHDSRLFTRELDKDLSRYQLAPDHRFECRSGAEDFETLMTRVMECKPAVVTLIAGADDSARILATLRQSGYSGPVFGGPAMGRRRFWGAVGDRGDDVVFPLVLDPGDREHAFFRTFQRRFGHEADQAAAHTYDAVRLVIAALGRSGLNRARLRDELAAISPWKGVSGAIRWDGLGSNTRDVTLGTIRRGRLTSASPLPGPIVLPPRSTPP